MLLNTFKARQGAVAGAIINKNNLGTCIHTLQHVMNFLIEELNVLFLIIQRDYYRKIHKALHQ